MKQEVRSNDPPEESMEGKCVLLFGLPSSPQSFKTKHTQKKLPIWMYKNKTEECLLEKATGHNAWLTL